MSAGVTAKKEKKATITAVQKIVIEYGFPS